MTADTQKESREKLVANLIAACSLVVTIVFGALTYHLSRHSAKLEATNTQLAREKLDLETRLARVAEASKAPSMDVQYIIVRDQGGIDAFAKSHKYLLQRNQVIQGGKGGMLVVLKITNRGGTQADEVSLVVDEIKPEHADSVEVLSPSDFHQRGAKPVPGTRQPLRLGSIPQGETRLIPVFWMHQVDPEAAGAVLGGLAYIPRSIQYTDAVSHEAHNDSVREMLECPFDMVGDIEVRG